MFRKAFTASLVTIAAAGAVVALTDAPASAADQPTFCGNWLQQPSKASNIRTVPGTEGRVDDPQEGEYIRVREGSYGGHWYAWAQLVNSGQNSSDTVALLWKYTPNGGLYQCGDRSGGSGWALDYTAGVRDTQSSRVQPKFQTGNGRVELGAAVPWR
ncbi:hypothetical protein ACLQ29_24045 [Micromonospora sp. DT228]|uniref:hypothetical protein n=1 Tax=Micromonospora sp. DT228 TaxID=3393443 RepID=UPI003CE7E167